ncbi:DUF3137 domain-containing protein [Microbacterium marinilacus]|uniref:DUF3137 domain-containing protein n=1 Tax=Microbacterium marinilacus TaxID=415209 RepID=UPI001C8DAEA5|nr:DUF3137 domain-containing protein [Microbacterium marinilacus]MBY0688282.1 DUF3137 domain-containing protein [Microbacterium marinilacus]
MTTPHPAPRTYPFDARPLTDPVDPQAVKRFHTELTRRFPGTGMNVVALVVVLAVTVPLMLGMLGAVTAFISVVAVGGLGLLVVPAVLGVIAVVGVLIWLAVRHFGGSAKERRYRLDGFARANAMQYMPRLATPPLPGMIFDRGSSRLATDLLRGEQPRFAEFANYQYTTGSGKNQTTHRWGYVAIHLDTPLPHIVLDAVGNNGLFGSNLPASFSKQQRLSLEGDFDQYFTLYCPQGYEADALYLFTPDIMVRFMDNLAQLDVEIVDDWLFLYAGRPVSTTDPATWAWLFSAVSALMDKLAQWARWRDERLAAEHARLAQAAALPATAAAPPGSPVAAGMPMPLQPHAQAPSAVAPPTPTAWLGPKGVAQPGRRLRSGIPWAAVVIIVVALGFIAVPMLLGPLSLLLFR